MIHQINHPHGLLVYTTKNKLELGRTDPFLHHTNMIPLHQIINNSSPQKSPLSTALNHFFISTISHYIGVASGQRFNHELERSILAKSTNFPFAMFHEFIDIWCVYPLVI